MIELVLGKVRKFRPTLVSIVLLVIATVRMFLGCNAIWLVGVCAGVVPFICQFKRYPARPEGVSEAVDTAANFLANIVYLCIYLLWMLAVTKVGSAVWPGYETNPAFVEQLLLAVCSDMVFISCVYLVGHKLSAGQRLGLGVLLCNGQLGFMLLVTQCTTAITGIGMLDACCLIFIALIFALTFAFIRMAEHGLTQP